jgi:hypothetical protein
MTQDEERIRDYALRIHRLAGEVEHPADLLFALAVATAGHICQHFPREQWGQLAVEQLKLLIKMINEYPTDGRQPPTGV